MGFCYNKEKFVDRKYVGGEKSLGKWENPKNPNKLKFDFVDFGEIMPFLLVFYCWLRLKAFGHKKFDEKSRIFRKLLKV